MVNYVVTKYDFLADYSYYLYQGHSLLFVNLQKRLFVYDKKQYLNLMLSLFIQVEKIIYKILSVITYIFQKSIIYLDNRPNNL